MSIDCSSFVRGPVLVIDDNVNQETSDDQIGSIVGKLEEMHYPLIKKTQLPSQEEIGNLNNLAFVVLDWKLVQLDNILVPPEISAKQNVVYIENQLEACFCPIFIFSNEDSGIIEDSLKDLLQDHFKNVSSALLIVGKNYVANCLEKTLEDWFTKNPQMAVCKAWDNEYQMMRNKVFNDYSSISPSWPSIMMSTFKADDIDKNMGMTDFLKHVFMNRMSVITCDLGFVKEKINHKPEEAEIDALKGILQEERFVKANCPYGGVLKPGDLFLIPNPKKKKNDYWVVITPECDLIARTHGSVDQVKLLCIRGKPNKIEFTNKDDGSNNDLISHGSYIEKVTECIVPFIDDIDSICFSLKEHFVFTYNEISEYYIGRIVMPYSGRIQQRFSLFIQRLGQTRIPEIIVEHYKDESEKKIPAPSIL